MKTIILLVSNLRSNLCIFNRTHLCFSFKKKSLYFHANDWYLVTKKKLIGTLRTKYTNTALGQKFKLSFPIIKRKKKSKASIVSLEAIGTLVKSISTFNLNQ